jgi:glycine/D-amino acid oxidase-like deaminating enzyme
MIGMSLGPGTGRIIAQIISDEKPQIVHPTLDPDRFN